MAVAAFVNSICVSVAYVTFDCSAMTETPRYAAVFPNLHLAGSVEFLLQAIRPFWRPAPEDHAHPGLQSAH
jgi:hypothetical protein